MTRYLAMLAVVLALTAGFGASASASAATPTPVTARLHTGATSPAGAGSETGGPRRARPPAGVVAPHAAR